MIKKEKSICFFGIYNSNYSRNQVLKTGLQAHGWTIIDCRVDPKEHSGFKKYWQLFSLFKNYKNKVDIIFVAYPAQSVLWLAKVLGFKKYIVVDAFISLYDSNVYDRRLYSAFSWRGIRDYLLDKLTWCLADLALVDTKQHLEFWQKTFGVKKNTMVVYLGSKIDERLPIDRLSKADTFLVHFHGHYIPLQGIEYIVGAAQILASEKDIKFRLIGSGQEYKKIQMMARQLKNIEFMPELDFADLVGKIKGADLVLGIFGNTPKTKRVIPNKVFEGLALGKPILTADTPAIRELLIDSINVILCQSANSKSLAEEILRLKKDLPLRESIGREAKILYDEELSPKKLTAELANFLERQYYV